MILKIASWNVNGLRSYIVDDLPSGKFKGKTEIKADSNLGELVATFDPDLICFQETRCDSETMEQFQIPGYYNYHSSSQGTGARTGNRYSGVAIWSKIEATQVLRLLPTLPEPLTVADQEGRFISIDLGPNIGVVINTYQPNAGTNFSYRVNRWDPAIRNYIASLIELARPVIWCGDLNVARTPLDLHIGQLPVKLANRVIQKIPKELEYQSQTSLALARAEQIHWETLDQPGPGEWSPANYHWNPGFTLEERLNLEITLEIGLVDAWRQLHPDAIYSGYTWWNQRIPSYRKNNRGWRIDYCLIDRSHLDRLVGCETLPQIGCRTRDRPDINKYGSDHGVITMTLGIPN
jgi:exodeoxyribonuclease-3